MVSQSAAGVRWTTRDLEVMPQNEWITYEIIDGELFVTRSPHRRHQRIAGKIFSALDAWSEQSGLGEPILSPGVILSDADNVIPDVVWVTKERLAVIEDEAGHLTGVPELLVEVLSSGSQNISRDREAKLKLYSVRGAREYWIVDRFSKQIEVYRRENAQLVLATTLTAEDLLSSSLLPGFRCQVSQFFS
ncbi:Uma2 family endonuclease [Leptolyngbya sp. BC1307]|uniref:Uma2 family endonuclease n=1 Tax=Leptolyngbya sp. BC1307 TaxID=2029589 RepID=UPI000EFD4E21|nr:Uma2 family endonuclease [Leptolyngbya sp. BC1307]